MRSLVKIVPLTLAVAAALGFSASSGAQIPTTGLVLNFGFGSKPAFSAETLTQGVSSALVGVGGTSIGPAQVVVDLAAGYSTAAPPTGSQVGLAILAAESGTGINTTIALISAEITADDPGRYANDPSAQACAPGPYTAVWRLSTTVLGLGYNLPIFVGHPAGNPAAIELRFCPPPLTGSDGKPLTTTPVPLSGATFILSPLTAPTAAGDYLSHAFVTPPGAGGAPDAANTFELQFLQPQPHSLTLHGRYDAKTHDAVLTGRVTEIGKPQGGATVDVIRANSLATPKRVHASAKGTFTTRIRITATTTFGADVPDVMTACQGTSTAPGGCLSLTIAGSDLAVARVVVPKK